MKLKKVVASLLAVAMVLSSTACGNKKSNTNNTDTGKEVTASGKYDTIVLGETEFNGVFSPFFYQSQFDSDVFSQVLAKICELNENNELIPGAGELTAEEIKDDSGKTVQTKYTVKLKEGMKFSDGKPVTIDDVIFGYYVFGDPNYDGMATLNQTDIVGLKEYFYDSPDYSSKMKEFEEQANQISDEEVQKFIESYTDKDIEENGAEAVNDALGFGLDASASDFEKQVREAYLKMNQKDASMKEQAISAKLDELTSTYVKGNLEDGIDVPEITGIQKVDDLTCTILINGVDIRAERELTDIQIAPKHYYGVSSDGTEFSKGKIEIVKEKNAVPMGSGPYIFKSYENNIVSLTANPDYYAGTPKIPNVKLQVVNENNKVDAVSLGDIDITDPSAQKEVMERIKTEGINYTLVDNNGFGYIAISAKRIPDKNVRKGLMSLMNRKPAIESYYGELASVLERPMTSTLAEYPVDAKEYYGYNPQKAMEYFEKAGYQKNESGKLVDAAGKQLKIEVGIGDLSSHPSAGILTQMKTDMDKLGAELLISDLDFNVLNDRQQNDDLDMWVMAWGDANDCDLSQLYHSSKTVKGGSNRVWIQDKELDKLLTQTRQTLDLEKRKEIVAKELDIIMDWAVVMPVYQRKNLIIYNPATVKYDTVPESSTPYLTYKNHLYKLELY